LATSYDEEVPPPGRFVDVATGAFASCALAEAGDVACWGSSSLEPSSRVSLGLALDIQNIAACVVQPSGAVRCWGEADEIVDNVPHTGTYTRVAVGNDHACALTTDGEITCWGANDEGQLDLPALPPEE
jgi:hypothetical protein